MDSTIRRLFVTVGIIITITVAIGVLADGISGRASSAGWTEERLPAR